MPRSKGVPGFAPDRLRDIRTAKGLTQEQLADRAGIQRQMISRLERHSASGPGPDTLALLAKVLDTEPAAFLDDVEITSLGDLRARAALTQTQAADAIGRSRSWYAMAETGRIDSLPDGVAQRLAELLGVDAQLIERLHQADVRRNQADARVTVPLKLTLAEADALGRLLDSADLGADAGLLRGVAERLGAARNRA